MSTEQQKKIISNQDIREMARGHENGVRVRPLVYEILKNDTYAQFLMQSVDRYFGRNMVFQWYVNQVRTALRVRDEDGARVWYHTIEHEPIWFHRDDATLEEILAFADYLEDCGKRYFRQAKLCREYAADKFGVRLSR